MALYNRFGCGLWQLQALQALLLLMAYLSIILEVYSSSDAQKIILQSIGL